MTDILLNFYPLITSFSSVIVSQTLKILLSLTKSKKRISNILQPGGMPSSHAACVTGLTTGIGIQEGLQSTIFMVSFIFTLVVLYDAAGVRYAVSQHAKVLNILTRGEYKFDEYIGHRPIEVIVGVIIGFLISLTILYVTIRI